MKSRKAEKERASEKEYCQDAADVARSLQCLLQPVASRIVCREAVEHRDRDHRRHADGHETLNHGRLMSDRFNLNKRAKNWIAGIRAGYHGVALDAPAAKIAEAAFKIL